MAVILETEGSQPWSVSPPDNPIDVITQETIPIHRLYRIRINNNIINYDIITLKRIVYTQQVPKEPTTNIPFTDRQVTLIGSHPVQIPQEAIDNHNSSRRDGMRIQTVTDHELAIHHNRPNAYGGRSRNRQEPRRPILYTRIPTWNSVVHSIRNANNRLVSEVYMETTTYRQSYQEYSIEIYAENYRNIRRKKRPAINYEQRARNHQTRIRHQARTSKRQERNQERRNLRLSTTF